MPIIDRTTREKDLVLKQQLETMSPQDRIALKQQIQSELQRRGAGTGQGFGQRLMGAVGEGINTAGDILLQRGGLKAPETQKTSDLDELIKLYKFDLERKLGAEKLKGVEATSKHQEDLARKFAEQQAGLQEVGQPAAQPTAPVEPIAQPALPTTAQPVTPMQATPIQATQTPSPTITKVTRKADGTYEEKEVDNPAYKQWEEKFKSGIKASEESQKGIRMSEGNVTLVAGALKRLADTYSEAVKEGGAGNIFKAGRSFVATKTGLGKQFPHAAALPGAVTEVITRMMPILTQQGDKPGSVRLVSTVFEKLLNTVMSLSTAPEAAKEMLNTTVRNMFGFAKAIRGMGLTDESFKNVPDNQLNNVVQHYAQSIELSQEEQQQLDMLLGSVTESISGASGDSTDEYNKYLQAIGK